MPLLGEECGMPLMKVPDYERDFEQRPEVTLHSPPISLSGVRSCRQSLEGSLLSLRRGTQIVKQGDGLGDHRALEQAAGRC